MIHFKPNTIWLNLDWFLIPDEFRYFFNLRWILKSKSRMSSDPQYTVWGTASNMKKHWTEEWRQIQYNGNTWGKKQGKDGVRSCGVVLYERWLFRRSFHGCFCCERGQGWPYPTIMMTIVRSGKCFSYAGKAGIKPQRFKNIWIWINHVYMHFVADF